MKRQLLVVLGMLAMLILLDGRISCVQSQQGAGSRSVTTKMDSVMAKNMQIFNTAFEATKQGDVSRFQKLVQSGNVIMVARGTACRFLRDLGDNFVAVTVSGKEGEWVTPAVAFIGFK